MRNVGDSARIKNPPGIDKLITNNKKQIKLLQDINNELQAKKAEQTKLDFLQAEVDDLEAELRNVRDEVNNAWKEKIRIEQSKCERLESEWKKLIAEIDKNADTPGYQQAMKHTDLQTGVRNKDAPSIRTNYKNTAARLQKDIKTIQQRVNAIRLKLLDEIQKKTSLEEEIRELRSSMLHKRSITPSKFASSVPDLNLRTTARVSRVR